jgi:hypothetical protein
VASAVDDDTVAAHSEGTLHLVHGAWQAAAVSEYRDPEELVDLQFRIGRLSMDPHRIIYATILLMTAYAIYDEGTSPLKTGAYLELLGLSIAPLFALAMAHAFSDALDLQIRNQRRLTGHDRRHLAATNLQYLYVAIPPMLLIVALGLLDWDANDVIGIVQLMGLVSLGWWGYYAGRKAGVGRLRRWTFAINYALMGLVVILVELILTH